MEDKEKLDKALDLLSEMYMLFEPMSSEQDTVYYEVKRFLRKLNLE